MWLYLVALLALYLLRRWYRERQMVRNLPDKHVFITGCDSGFGHLLAKQLDGRGLRVLAACLTEQGAERLRQETSGRLQTVILDVTKSDSITAAAAWVKVQVGDRGLWGLVNNAGIGAPTGPNEFLSKADFVKVLDVNLVGLIEVTLSLLPLVRRAQGRIVNVASVMGRLAVFGGGYGPSKYGVEAFSDSLRRELRDFRVKVSIIEPGGFRTPILDVQRVQKSLEQVWSCASANVKEAYGQQYLDCCIEKLKELLFTTSPKLHLVTDAMEHALTARHPRTRYSCGWDAKLFYLPVSYLPTSWADYLLTCSTPKPAQGI
ncbi:17-beta-hydroxysteroid dehydrogenase type 6-like isoform X2 [Alligator sinensis]|uniref:17-beta-hydroxysteroid dehydrogenase type 6-like isoform X2 n=1 Tax=Alligator sinensis TaxID=38654 RepID=A0A1U8DKX8_ALLSI|nr:17-beta-hydroxysteroid dehydrogenase type 6-like isoform X2 [Alligator sinensis]